MPTPTRARRPSSTLERGRFGRGLAVLCLLAGCEVSSASTHAISSTIVPGAAPTPKPATPAPKAAPCAPGMAHVGSFCIDRYEGHLVTLHNEREILHSPYHPLETGQVYLARSAAGVVPQGYISREEASRACQAAGKRLCRAREWQKTCKGRAGFKYPYGRDEVVHQCNTRRPHLPARFFGPTVTRFHEQHLNDPRLNQQPGFLAKTGEHTGCQSDYGVFDMMGNLHEWVSDDVNSSLPKKVPIPYGTQNIGRRGNGVFMGGYFSSKREHGRGCEYVTTHHAPTYHDYSTGFRCCADAMQ